MTTLREAAELALEALNNLKTRESVETEIAVLRAALASQIVPSDCLTSHQPDSWRSENRNDFGLPVFFCASEVKQAGPGLIPLYTHPPQHQEANPVVWQFRMRPDWVRDKDFWGPWTNCTKEQAADYQRVPHLHDWTYESRSLFTHPPKRKPLTNEEINALVIEWWCPTMVTAKDRKFVRAIEQAQGIGGEE